MKTTAVATAFSVMFGCQAWGTAAIATEWKVLSEKTVTGFGHVESVGYDAQGKVFYTSDFGPALKPADKDGKGKITEVSLDGKILEDGVLPPKGTVMNKPKGIWVADGHLWVTDIDSVWEFDLKKQDGQEPLLARHYLRQRSGDPRRRALRQRQPV
jgi:hypothetical protein